MFVCHCLKLFYLRLHIFIQEGQLRREEFAAFLNPLLEKNEIARCFSSQPQHRLLELLILLASQPLGREELLHWKLITYSLSCSLLLIYSSNR